MGNEKTNQSIRKTTLFCSLVASVICIVAIIIEWFQTKKIDEIWIILLVVNIIIIIANKTLNKK